MQSCAASALQRGSVVCSSGVKTVARPGSAIAWRVPHHDSTLPASGTLTW